MNRRALLWLSLIPMPASAQPIACSVPEALSLFVTEAVPAAEVKRVPVTGYLLALSWSPQYCRGRQGAAEDRAQCDTKARFGFILHGLWPEGDDQRDPAWCASVKPLPSELIRRHFCMTPSVALIQHEWAKHGSCMTDDPVRYFDEASRLYRAFRFPDMTALSRQTHSTASFAQAVAHANRGLRPDMLRIMVDRSGWLKEVRLCLGRDRRPRRCPLREPGKPSDNPLRIWLG